MRYMTKTAEISPCGQYRYRLGRLWDKRLPACMWVMLNPSTADASIDDRTIKRCVDYSVRWGYGELLVGNLFGWRATNRKELRQVEDPVGPENDRHLRAMLAEAGSVVCAWGYRWLVSREGHRGDGDAERPRPRPCVAQGWTTRASAVPSADS